MSAVARTLVRALLARAGDDARVVEADERDWASITFEGLRHRIVLDLPIAQAAAFAEDLEDWDLPLPRHLLADLAIEARDDGDDGRTRLVVVGLTLAVPGGTIPRAPTFGRS